MAGERHPSENHITLTETVAELRRMQARVIEIDKEKANKEDAQEEELTDSQPLSQALWDAKVPDNFRTPHLPTFDGKYDPTEHLMAVGTQTSINYMRDLPKFFCQLS
jgi:hypothetical protein